MPRKGKPMNNLKTLISHYILSDPDGNYLPDQWGSRHNAEAMAYRLNCILDRQGDEGGRYCVGLVDHAGDVHFDI
jgi:hypothetical protein